MRLTNSTMPKNRDFTVFAKISDLNYCRKCKGYSLGHLFTIIHSNSSGIRNNTATFNKQPLLVLLYTRLYAAFLGFVNQPMPRGALKPKLCLKNRFGEVRAAMRFLSDGVRNPNFIIRTYRTNVAIFYKPPSPLHFNDY